MSEPDDTLTQLFAAAEEPLPSDDFVQGVLAGIERGRRRRAVARTALTVAAAGVAVAATPYVAVGSLTVASHLSAWLPAFAHAVSSPLAWPCAAAVTAWGLRRANVF
jgi:hypothetical protein